MEQRRRSGRSRRGRMLHCSNGAQYTVRSAAVKLRFPAVARVATVNPLFIMNYAAFEAAGATPSSASRSASAARVDASRTWPKPRILSGSDASFTARS